MSEDNHDKPLKVINTVWDVVSALAFIRERQPLAHNWGWNLALGGGVLNNGFSSGDLDVLAIPRPIADHPDLDHQKLLTLFPQDATMQEWEMKVFELPSPKRIVYPRFCALPKPPVELIVFLPS